ncbi:MAG: hypothetical protein ACTSRW_05545 [Candidatus Helarchaeota archaeon]
MSDEKPAREKSEKKGIYVVFEGSRFTGKTTMRKEIAEWLRSTGSFQVLEVEEASEKMRQSIREIGDEFDNEIDDDIDIYDFVSDTLRQNKRIRHFFRSKPSKPELQKIVIAERSFLSSIVYQNDVGKQRIWDLHGIGIQEHVLMNPKVTSKTFYLPDLVIVLDVEVEEMPNRYTKETVLEKWDRDLNYLMEVRKRFRELGNISYRCTGDECNEGWRFIHFETSSEATKKCPFCNSRVIQGKPPTDYDFPIEVINTTNHGIKEVFGKIKSLMELHVLNDLTFLSQDEKTYLERK